MEGAKFSRDSVQLGGSGYSLWCGSSVCTQPAPHLEVSAARLPYTVGGADMDLAEAEDIKKRWQEYTEELYKKGLNDPDNHNGVVSPTAR